METVMSKDGTSIAFQQSGSGPPLILVHGTSASHSRWATVAPTLEEHFTVQAVDRRGRGESGDAGAYVIEREFEDVAAVVDSIDEPVALLGHSHGAICALEAALLTGNIHKLILYEPPIPVPGAPLIPEGLFHRLTALLDAGEREEMLAMFFREIVRMPERELERYRALPAWRERVVAAHTVLREVRAVERYHFAPARFSNLETPTLLLLGGDSPAFLRLATETVEAVLPNSKVVVLPGQQHIAMDTASDLFKREVLAFLQASSQVVDA